MQTYKFTPDKFTPDLDAALFDGRCSRLSRLTFNAMRLSGDGYTPAYRAERLRQFTDGWTELLIKTGSDCPLRRDSLSRSAYEKRTGPLRPNPTTKKQRGRH